MYGVNCQVFSDINCNNYIGQTGNHVGTSENCYPFANAKSVKVRFKRSSDAGAVANILCATVLLQVLNAVRPFGAPSSRF